MEDDKPTTVIPAHVSRNWKNVKTHVLHFVAQPQALNQLFKPTLWVKKHPFSSQISVEDLPLRITNNRTLIFRGQRRDSFFRSLTNGFIASPDTSDNDFGIGIYYTFDLSVAKEYAKVNGVILIVDFSDGGGDLRQKTFLGDGGWQDFVKKNVCYGAPTVGSGPVNYDVDFIIGPSSANHGTVKDCSTPIPSTANQIMGKSKKSWEYFANNLLGVIYFC